MKRLEKILIALSCLGLAFTGSIVAQGPPEDVPAGPPDETPADPEQKPDETPADPDPKPDGAGKPDEDPAQEENAEDVEKPEDEDVEQPDGEVEQPDGEVEQPDGEVEQPDGDVEQPDGDVEEPDGDVEEPDGDGKPDGVGKPEDTPSRDDVVDEAKDRGRPDFVDEIKAVRDQYNEARTQLREGLKERLAALGSEATREEIEQAVSEFREEHAKLIADQKSTAEEIRNAAKEVAQEHVPAHAAAMKELVMTKKAERDEARDRFRAALDDPELTAEGKKEAVESFRSEQRDLHVSFKEQLKALREQAREQANEGDRRSDR